ncbi:uncharacterized protein LOC105197335 [Solenopsis invicta]|nr:uncharacterized protein LOC105197335 [Solenopsis invicta]
MKIDWIIKTVRDIKDEAVRKNEIKILIKEVVQEELGNVKQELENFKKIIQGAAYGSREGLQRSYSEAIKEKKKENVIIVKTKLQQENEDTKKVIKEKVDIKNTAMTGALRALTEVLDGYRIDITALQEIRWTGQGTIDKQRHTVIIKSHAPTEEKPQNEKEEFYEDLEAVYRHCPKNDIKIIMGDMNAKVRQEPIFSLTIGRNTFHKKSNDNGLRLINLAALLNMASTCFQNRNIHKAALVSPDGSTNQIDHLLIETRHGSDILDCHRYRGANVDLDHYLVIAKLRLSAWPTALTLDLAFRTEETLGMDDRWNRVKREMRSGLEETVGLERHTGREKWYDEESAEATRARNKAYKRMQTRKTRATTEEYQEKRRAEKRIHRAKKRAFFERQLQSVENLNRAT